MPPPVSRPPGSRPPGSRPPAFRPRGYVPLRAHGHHSLLTGVDSPAGLLARARSLGLSALALADVDTTSGLTEFLREAEALTELDPARAVRPIVAAELTQPPRHGGRDGSGPGASRGRLVALVRDERGYKNLLKLISARRLGDDPGSAGADLPGPQAFDLVEAAVRFREGLILVADHPQLLIRLAGRVPASDLFAALSPAGVEKRPWAATAPLRAGQSRNVHRAPLPAHRPARERDAQRDAARGHDLEDPKTPPPARAVPVADMIEAARAAGVATLAVPDVYFALPQGVVHHRVRTAIKHNALAGDLDPAWLAESPAHLPAAAELRALFADVPDVPGPFGDFGFEAELRPREDAPLSGDRLSDDRHEPGCVARTRAVAARCRFVPPLGGVLFPEVELEPGESAYSKLVRLAFEGAGRRYRPLRPEVTARLQRELAAIDDLGFAAYFLLVRRIADFAREQGIPCVGRGSAADSLVAYCLGLTDADPLRYRLPFERFLNPARQDRPDIDLDFCWRRRDEVIHHVYEAFGPERTAMISTLNRFGLRSAFREAALAAGLPPPEVNRWSKRLPWALPGQAAEQHDGSADSGSDADSDADELSGQDEAGESFRPQRAGEHLRADDTTPDDGRPPLPPGLADNPVARAFHVTPECRDFPFDDPRFAEVLRTAARLVDAPRHLGLHPGGVVVSPGPITDHVACQRAAKGVVVTQLDKDGVEAVGLVKMDLLGNRALTVIDDCLKSLRARGVEVDLYTAPEDEPRTAELLASGRTLGCFQVESPGMRNLLQQTGACTMDDVIQAVALIRPGPASSGMKDAYIRRFRGLEEPTPPHPSLAPVLADTHGVMLYQEDVMQVAAVLAGLDLAQADQLRRALAKSRGQGLAVLRREFLDGCEANGVEREAAARVWELIANFASFGFCKAHAVTYGRISWRTVYLKAHHPADFLAAFLASDTGYYQTRVYVEEARRLGVRILGPDVNKSEAEFCALEHDGVPALRIGLGEVKGLTGGTLERLLEARRAGGAFFSLPDFLERTGARTDEVEKLVQCGAFDAFDRTRPELLWRLHLLRAPRRALPRARPGEEPLDVAQYEACRRIPLAAHTAPGVPGVPGVPGASGASGASGALGASAALGDSGAHSVRDAPPPLARGDALGNWSAPRIGLAGREPAAGEEASLFPDPPTPALALPRLPDPDWRTRALAEFEVLRLTVDAHPVEVFPLVTAREGEVVDRSRLLPCGEVTSRSGERVTVAGWLAASRRVRTRDGRWMRFLTLEDESGTCEAVVFADVYARDGHRLTSSGPYRVRGTVEDHMGACTLHVEFLG